MIQALDHRVKRIGIEVIRLPRRTVGSCQSEILINGDIEENEYLQYRGIPPRDRQAYLTGRRM